jgi:anionic cell wall polymer biosynthesis LytR-Cps2A-Psr (LCP) family protein
LADRSLTRLPVDERPQHLLCSLSVRENSDFATPPEWLLAGIREQAADWDLASKAPGLISAALGSIETNMTPSEILSLISWLINLDGSRIKQSLIKGEGKIIGGQSVVIVDQETLRKAGADLLSPPKQTAADASTSLTAQGAENVSLASPAWKSIRHVPFH